MKISSFEYSFIDALKSLKRNRSLSTASVATVAATLFIFGVFLLVTVNMNLAIKGVESQLEVQIVLQKDITMDQQNIINGNIKNTKGVESVSYETQAQALENFKKTLGDKNKDILQGLEKNNPLPNSYIVKVTEPKYITDVTNSVKGLAGVESVEDGREIVDKVMTITNTIKIVGAFIFIILLAISFFLIGNTIKLTVFSRRREIGIMKYIGATDWFIKVPFIIEGVIIGILGALVSNVILYFIYKFVTAKALASVTFMQLQSPGYVISALLWQFILVGILVGSAASVVSVRKFLDV